MNPTPMPAPSLKKKRRKKTNIDIAAMEALMNRVLEIKSVSLDMGNKRSAERLRFQFYEWRRREQDINGTTLWDEVICQVEDNIIRFNAQSANPVFREALRKVGIKTDG